MEVKQLENQIRELLEKARVENDDVDDILYSLCEVSSVSYPI